MVAGAGGSVASFELGTVQWGIPYGIANQLGRPPLEEVEAILREAARAGLTSLDTARAYGESEAVIGALTAGDPSWHITTKLDPGVLDGDAAQDVGLARENLARSLDASRSALRRNRFDLLLHRAAHRTAHAGALFEQLCEARDKGEIGRLGVSVGNPEEAWAVLGDPRVDRVQLSANLLDQRLVRSGFFRAARADGLAVTVRSVFLQGVAHLADRPIPSHLRGLEPALQIADHWARERSLRRPDAFLAYARSVLDVPVLIGTESVGQLLANLISWRSALVADEEVTALADAVHALGVPDVSLVDPALWAA